MNIRVYRSMGRQITIGVLIIALLGMVYISKINKSIIENGENIQNYKIISNGIGENKIQNIEVLLKENISKEEIKNLSEKIIFQKRDITAKYVRIKYKGKDANTSVEYDTVNRKYSFLN